MATRFNKMNYFKRFDATQEFVALKRMTLGGVELSGGDLIDKDSVSAEMIRKLFRARKVGFADANKNAAHAAKVVKSFEKKEAETETATPVVENPSVEPETQTEPMIIEKKAGWLVVEFNGQQIGKATRDRDEAEMTVLEWMEENPNGLAT